MYGSRLGKGLWVDTKCIKTTKKYANATCDVKCVDGFRTCCIYTVAVLWYMGLGEPRFKKEYSIPLPPSLGLHGLF